MNIGWHNKYNLLYDYVCLHLCRLRDLSNQEGALGWEGD